MSNIFSNITIMIILYITAGLLILASVKFVLLLIAIKPAKKREKVTAFIQPYAHRGLHNQDAPENTLAAFIAAVDAGYGMELDVQLTADGKLVVFHDNTLERLCGVAQDIRDTEWEALKEYRILGSDQGIPLFTDVLKTVDGRTPLLIEVKSHYNPRDIMGF